MSTRPSLKFLTGGPLPYDPLTHYTALWEPPLRIVYKAAGRSTQGAGMPRITVCEYMIGVRNFYAKFEYVFLFLGLQHSGGGVVRTGIARGCQAATRSTTLS